MSPLSRRSFLRGAGGALLSLPWLESIAKVSPQKTPTQRLAFFYTPIGVVRKGFFPGEADAIVPAGNQSGRMKSDFVPSIAPGFHKLELTPTLSPLESVKDKVTLITGLDRKFQNGTDVHAQCASCFLSSPALFRIQRWQV